MAPFNQRQIGYIQAIAGRQQHRTLICGQVNTNINSDTVPTSANLKPQTLDSNRVEGHGYSGTSADAKSLLLYTWLLDNVELGFDSRTVQNNDQLDSGDFTGLEGNNNGMGNYTALNVFDALVAGTAGLDTQGNVLVNTNTTTPTAQPRGSLELNDQYIPSNVRATQDGFLNSTHLTFRFTLPRTLTDSGPAHHTMGQDHYEFRWIVWRSKLPTMHFDSKENADHSNLEAVRDGKSFRNPGYDLFMGQTGRKRGFLGWTHNADLDKDKLSGGTSVNTEIYAGHRWGGSAFTTDGTVDSRTKPEGEADFTVDDLMTMRINKDDYVVMKDVRFFLGKQYGKSHFEDTLHWDWNDPIDTAKQNVLTSPTLNNKNYRWHITLLGTSGGKSPCSLNVQARWTTKMESG